jgi:hypothetical protein
MKTPLPIQMLAAAEVQTLRIPYAARRVARDDIATLVVPRCAPQAGDVLLARVDEIGQHAQLELAGGRKSRLFVGDRIVLVFGNRYAPDQYEARVPETIRPCHMVAAGGIAAHMLKRHSRVRGATRITPMGLLGDRSGQAGGGGARHFDECRQNGNRHAADQGPVARWFARGRGQGHRHGCRQ